MAPSQDPTPQSPKKARPQSLMALSFSAELDNLFHIDNSVEDLVLDVDRKHQSTTLLSFELSALNNRLRDTEDRLKKARRASIRMGLTQVYQPSGSGYGIASLAHRSRRRESGGTDSNESSEGSASGSENLEELKEVPEQEEEEDGGDGWQPPKKVDGEERLRVDARGLARKWSHTTLG